MNNPLKYIDPSGYTKKKKDDPCKRKEPPEWIQELIESWHWFWWNLGRLGNSEGDNKNPAPIISNHISPWSLDGPYGVNAYTVSTGGRQSTTVGGGPMEYSSYQNIRYSSPQISAGDIASTALSTSGAIAGELYYSKRYGTWMGKDFKLYKQTWGGNGITGGKNKFAKTTRKAIKWGGRALGAWNAYQTIDQRINNEIGTFNMSLELVSTGISTFGGLYGAAWGIGWELGRAFTTLDAYQEFKFNYWYDYLERRIGPPNEINEGLWYDFFNDF